MIQGKGTEGMTEEGSGGEKEGKRRVNINAFGTRLKAGAGLAGRGVTLFGLLA